MDPVLREIFKRIKGTIRLLTQSASPAPGFLASFVFCFEATLKGSNRQTTDVL